MCWLELWSRTMQTLNSYEGFAEIIQWISKHGSNIGNVNVQKVGKGKGVPVNEGILQQETRVHRPTRWQTCITDPVWQSPSEAYLLVNNEIRVQMS